MKLSGRVHMSAAQQQPSPQSTPFGSAINRRIESARNRSMKAVSIPLVEKLTDFASVITSPAAKPQASRFQPRARAIDQAAAAAPAKAPIVNSRKIQRVSSSDCVPVDQLMRAGRSTPKGEVNAWTLSPAWKTSPAPLARFWLTLKVM